MSTNQHRFEHRIGEQIPGARRTTDTEGQARPLRTVRVLAKRYPDAFSEGSLRWAIHNAERNGLARSGAIVRIGRRVLIDEELFLRWIDEQQKQLAV